jgi:hypothetical protein
MDGFSSLPRRPRHWGYEKWTVLANYCTVSFHSCWARSRSRNF